MLHLRQSKGKSRSQLGRKEEADVRLEVVHKMGKSAVILYLPLFALVSNASMGGRALSIGNRLFSLNWTL